jgi:hypothetical protein
VRDLAISRLQAEIHFSCSASGAESLVIFNQRQAASEVQVDGKENPRLVYRQPIVASMMLCHRVEISDAQHAIAII